MVNYSPEVTAQMIEDYKSNPTKETVNRLAHKLGKSVKSIIGKLSKEGVYRRESYKTKTGERPITKDEIVVSICDMLGLETLDGLAKTPKITLKKLEEALQEG